MRKNIVAGNWKMNLNFEEGVSLFSEIVNMVKDEVIGNQEVVVCSPFIHLNTIGKLAETANNVSVGAQNIYQAESGAFTGEISASQVKSVGANYVILGHSERRAYFGETDAVLAEKVNVALKHGLTPIFCIGETKEERESGRFFEVIKSQLENGVFHLEVSDFSRIVLAYEPVWAIGTGETATADQAQEMHQFIREQIAHQYDREIAENVSILYGGSVKPDNAQEIFSKPDVDGGLIGGAALQVDDFTAIINAV